MAIAALLVEDARVGMLRRPRAAAAAGALLSSLGAAGLGAGRLTGSASLAVDRGAGRLPSALRVGVAGVKGLLAASSAATCKQSCSEMA